MMNDRRRVSTHDGGRLLLWTILLCCCNTVACDTSRQLEKFGMWYGKNFKELQAVGSRNSVPRLGYCDLDIDCDWEWTEVFKKVKAARTSASKAFPSTDASNSSSGHFLWFSGKGDAQIWMSKSIAHTSPHCKLEFWLYMIDMENGCLNLVIQTNNTNNNVSSLAVRKSGNNTATWSKLSFSLRPIDQSYKLALEVSLSNPNSSIGVDNLRLINCFPDQIADCTKDMFRCNNGSCLNRTRVCDFTKDCADGEDEASECVVRITTCGNTGRKGPTMEKCVDHYNNSDVELIVPSSIQEQKKKLALKKFDLVQRWTAPLSEYYTLIAFGARGGNGSSNVSSTLGALARGVIKLQKDNQLYFMTGQEGTNVCDKGTCQESKQSTDDLPWQQKYNICSGGGGATAIFELNANGELEPILIAGGGGGLGLNSSMNTESQKPNHPLHRCSSPSKECLSGAGGSWNDTPNVKETWGMPLIYGGIGGLGCGTDNKSGTEDHANGGFGGGGGGCMSGGGGGGYVGGNAGKNQGNGEGGHSYAHPRLTEVYLNPANHFGPGLVLVIRAIRGCGCTYRCIVLNQYMNKTKCLCPQGWSLSKDSKSCIMTDDSLIWGEYRTYIILLLVVTGLFIIIGICLISYKRYQKQEALSLPRRAMSDSAIELPTLNSRYVTVAKITESDDPGYCDIYTI